MTAQHNEQSLNDLELYKIVVEEYRFQVKFNWDRTKYFLSLNLSLLGVTAGLLRLDLINVYVAVILFLLGAYGAFSGRKILLKGHEYYREISRRKGELEQRLGLQSKAIDSTPGQKEAQAFLGSPAEWMARKLRTGSITSWVSRFFLALFFINLLGVAQSIAWEIKGGFN